jgi:multiple sugar transport system ATP-binding protein
MAEVTFNEVDKIYDGGVHAVQDLTLEARDGEFLVLVGPSGCGKTTALRMVAGLEDISDGTISIGNRVVNSLSPKERDIAMVFQNYALYPHLSVAENIAFGLRLRKTPKAEIEKRVAWASKMLDLTPYLARRPKELSGGQRQRVAMGRAIVRHPQVFLMDEPLSNLDAKLRVQMRADIAKLQHDLGTTTIYVTHDQVEAMTMGDRVAVMSLGLLQQVDTPQRLYETPANLFVAGFIGTPPMNLIQADVSTQNGTVSVTLAGQCVELSDAVLKRYPGTRGYAGRSVVFGVRSEDLFLAEERPDLPTIHASLQLLEALGSHTMAYFKIDAQAIRAGASGVEHEAEAEGDAEGVTAARPNVVASFPAAQALGLRLEQDVAIAINTANAHVFDHDSGAPLR